MLKLFCNPGGELPALPELSMGKAFAELENGRKLKGIVRSSEAGN